MALTVTHPFVCALADDPVEDAAGGIVISDWNASHTVSLVSLLDGDGSQVLVTKNTDPDNALNGNFVLTGGVSDINPISGRLDQTYALGYNVSSTGAPLLAGEPALHFSWESFFEVGGHEDSEFHIVYTNAGNTASYRWESWAVNRATDIAIRSSVIDTWYVTAASGTVMHTLSWNSGSGYGTWYFGNCRVYVEDNNIEMFHQRNAADSAYLALPYIDSNDRHVLRSINAVGAMPGGSNPFATFQPTSMAAGGTVLNVPLPTVSGGNANLMAANGSVSGTLMWQIFNQNSASSSSHVQHDLITGGASGGDPFFSVRVNGGGEWSFGLDNSDSDSFKLSRANGLGSNDALRVDGSNNARLYGNLGIANATNGQACEIKTLTELLTIAAAATSTTTIQKPANSIILAVPVRVTTAVTCTSTFTVGDAGSATRFSTAAVSKAANTTDKGTAAGAYYNATAEGIVITPDTVPSDATGRVRVTIYYIELTPPTS